MKDLLALDARINVLFFRGPFDSCPPTAALSQVGLDDAADRTNYPFAFQKALGARPVAAVPYPHFRTRNALFFLHHGIRTAYEHPTSPARRWSKVHNLAPDVIIVEVNETVSTMTPLMVPVRSASG